MTKGALISDSIVKLIADTLLDFENDNETIIDDGKSLGTNKTVLIVDATYKVSQERLLLNASLGFTFSHLRNFKHAQKFKKLSCQIHFHLLNIYDVGRSPRYQLLIARAVRVMADILDTQWKRANR